MLPLEGMTAFVLGTGPDLPTTQLARLVSHFTIGINRIWRTGFVPTVSFWIDGGVYPERPEHFDKTLCVCDASVAGKPEHIGLRMRGGELPEHPNPNRLCHLSNTGAVAALWAVSLGCYPVILLGMGCEDDGRLPTQLEAMRGALRLLTSANYRPLSQHQPTVWRWGAEDFESNMNHPHVLPTRPGEMVRRLRAFYA